MYEIAFGAPGNKCGRLWAMQGYFIHLLWWSCSPEYARSCLVGCKNLDTKALKKQDNEMSGFGMVFRNDLFLKTSVLNGQFSSYRSEFIRPLGYILRNRRDFEFEEKQAQRRAAAGRCRNKSHGRILYQGTVSTYSMSCQAQPSSAVVPVSWFRWH